MKKLYLLVSLFLSVATLGYAAKIGTLEELQGLFAQGNYDFAAEEGGDLWFADGWGNSVLAADFNGDGNKDVFVMGRVSYGEVTSATPQNILYLGKGDGTFTKHKLSNEGAYYLGYAHYIRLAKDTAIIAATGVDQEANWWDPMYNYGMKNRYKSSLHQLTFDKETGEPVWTLVKELEDGSCGAGASINLYDFNNDGNYDVLLSGTVGLPASESELISTYGGATQILYLGDGQGNFTRKTHVDTGLWPVQDGNAVVADLNGDGYLDVISVMGKSGAGAIGGKNEDGCGVYVSLNNGDCTFTTTNIVPCTKEGNLWFPNDGSGCRVQLIDINNDGALDFWFGLNDQKSADPWRYRGGFFVNDGKGVFTEFNKDYDGNAVTPLGVERATPLVGDFNQDGNYDLWYNSWLPTSDLDDPAAGNNFCALGGILLLGNGQGGFSSTIFHGENVSIIPAGYYQRFCALKSSTYAGADFNNDGIMDIVAIAGDCHNGDYKGLTYMKGVVAPTAKSCPLPKDNCLFEEEKPIVFTDRIGSLEQLQSLFAPGDYDFAAEEGGDLWFADGWGNSVLAADFNGDGNKDVFVMGRVSYGEVTSATPQNILYLGKGDGTFTKHKLSNEGAYYLGYAHYIKIADNKAIIAATGVDQEANWWDPMYNYGQKNRYKSSLHELSFTEQGEPVWTLVKELEDGSCGAGASINLYDFNKDGNYDVLLSGTVGLPASESELISTYGGATQILYLGDGQGNFTRKTHVDTGLWPVQDGNAVVADLNGDGYLDVISVMGKSGAGAVGGKNEDGCGVYVSLNNGDCTFTTTNIVPCTKEGNLWFPNDGSGCRVQLIDINNDGALDFWFGLNDQKSADPWRYRGGFFVNDGNGVFTEFNKDYNGNAVTPLGVERATPLVGDFNQDGNADLWYNSWLPTSDLDDPAAGNNFCALGGILLLGNGEGGFTTTIFPGEKGDVISGYYQRFCALKSSTYAGADFNNDGVMDIVAIAGDCHNGDYKGLTYMKGVVKASSKGMALPADNKLDKPQANEQKYVENAEMAYSNGTLYLRGLKGANVRIVSLTGVVVASFEVESADSRKVLSLGNGCYIVSANGLNKKIIVK